MFTLSGFADEISEDPEVQLDVLEHLQIGYLELRSVWGKNVLKLTDEEAQRFKALLDQRRIRVSAIGSPIGKIRIDDPFGPHLQDFDRALALAELFGTEYVRIFSFYVPEGEAAAYRSQVMERMRALVDRAKGRPVTLLHENERHIYGDVPSRCRDLLETVASPQLQMTFDPANFVMCGVHPMSDGYALLKDYIVYVHIKDGVMSEKRVVAAGMGDGQIRELLYALQAKQFSGFLSLEPHLAAAGDMQGFSGPELFDTATDALRLVLREIGARA